MSYGNPVGISKMIKFALLACIYMYMYTYIKMCKFTVFEYDY